METNFVNGLRVTDKDTMEVAEMVLNKVNKEPGFHDGKSRCESRWNQRKRRLSSESGEKAIPVEKTSDL